MVEEETTGAVEKSYGELIVNINPIAQPLAPRKLSKKLYKCVKKGKRPAALSGSERLSLRRSEAMVHRPAAPRCSRFAVRSSPRGS